MRSLAENVDCARLVKSGPNNWFHVMRQRQLEREENGMVGNGGEGKGRGS